MGNCDGPEIRHWGATDTAEIELGGVTIGMIHDSGVAKARRSRMRARFPEARVVLFGHSHIPCNEDEDGLLLLNPGSPTWKRTSPHESMALLWIENGVPEAEIVPV